MSALDVDRRRVLTERMPCLVARHTFDAGSFVCLCGRLTRGALPAPDVPEVVLYTPTADVVDATPARSRTQCADPATFRLHQLEHYQTALGWRCRACEAEAGT